MYKIIENNQIIDVMDMVKYVKYLPRSKRIITVDEKQANGCISSSGNEIYHIYGTPNNFTEPRRTVNIVPIGKEEYIELTTQLKKDLSLMDRILELEQKLLKLEQFLADQG